MSVEQLVALVRRASARYYGSEQLEEVIITGGEPTLDRDYLVQLVSALNDFTDWIVLDTNGYLLDESYLKELISAGLKEVMFDLKAWDEAIHRWYTGHSNRRVIANIRAAYGRVKMVVNTVYIPGIVAEQEIERIAMFLAQIDVNNEIDYRINRFRAELSHEKIARNPYDDEMERAHALVARYMRSAVIGKSCVHERSVKEKRGWITVFPDGTMKRRTLDDYRHDNYARVRIRT